MVLAGGSGTRVGQDGNKAYVPLAGRLMVSWTLGSLHDALHFRRYLLVIRPQDRDVATAVLNRELRGLPVELVIGGSSRHDSEYAALEALRPAITRGEVDVVLLHDAARPLISRTLIRSVVNAARQHGGAVPALVADDLAARAPTGHYARVDTSQLVRVQTPQAFTAHALLSAYEAAEREGFRGTDTSATMEAFSEVPVQWVHGDVRNLKVTFPEDIFVAEQLLSAWHYRMT